MRVQELKDKLQSVGAKPEHEIAVLRAWMRRQPLGQGRHAPFPAKVIELLPELARSFESLAQVKSEHRGADGSVRLLVALADGQLAETVLLPRDGVCVSSQVGCAVGCAFCMTGKSGLIRQLGSAEIVAQVQLAQARQKIRKVVFMGMGEPSHNIVNVLEAIDFLGIYGGIGHKQLVFSTVGDRRVFERLPLGRVKPALALSLHTTRADLRAELLPRAPRFEPAELVELAQEYAEKTTYPIQYQWTLLAGVNDSDEELEALVRLLARRRAILNLIPYNQVEGLEFRRPSTDRMIEMARILTRRGVLTKIRRSAGQDVDGGCGQLRARAEVGRTVL